MRFNLTKRQQLILAIILQVAVLFTYYKYTTRPSAAMTASVDEKKIRVKTNIEYYPDLTVEFKFRKPPSDTLIAQMNQFVAGFGNRYKAYASEISCDSDELTYQMLFDFQITPYSSGMFVEFISGLQQMEGSENIEAVTIQ